MERKRVLQFINQIWENDMKKSKAIFTILLLFCAWFMLPFSAKAEDGYKMTEDGLYQYEEISDGDEVSCRIVKYLGSETTATIPAEIGGISVTEIGKDAFKGSQIKYVDLNYAPIIAIREGAFSNCECLMEVMCIGWDLKIIEKNAFLGDDALDSFEIPGSVETIGEHAIGYKDDDTKIGGLVLIVGKDSAGENYALAEELDYYIEAAISYDYVAQYKRTKNNMDECIIVDITPIPYHEEDKLAIPDKIDGLVVSEISDASSFDGSEIVFPEHLKKIGNAAFAYLETLEKVTFNSALEEIGDYAFNDTNLSTVTFPKSLKYIGEGAFLNDIFLEKITFSEGLEYIGENAFQFCGVKSLKFPNSLQTIDDSAFILCKNLTSVKFGNSIESIGDSAFRECTNLQKVTIPDSVEKIGEKAFGYANTTEKVEDFVIVGGEDTAASKYAEENGFIFLLKTDEDDEENDVDSHQSKAGATSCSHEYALDYSNESSVNEDTEVWNRCQLCGAVKEHYIIPNSAFYNWNVNIAKQIQKAAQGATVSIDTDRWHTFHEMVLNALEQRQDVTLVVKYTIVGGKEHGKKMQMVIPAISESDPEATAKREEFSNRFENKFCGFGNLADYLVE